MLISNMFYELFEKNWDVSKVEVTNISCKDNSEARVTNISYELCVEKCWDLPLKDDSDFEAKINKYLKFLKSVPEDLILLWKNDTNCLRRIRKHDLEIWNKLSEADKQILIKYGDIDLLHIDDSNMTIGSVYENFYNIPIDVIDLYVRNFDYSYMVDHREYQVGEIIDLLIKKYGFLLDDGSIYTDDLGARCFMNLRALVFYMKPTDPTYIFPLPCFNPISIENINRWLKLYKPGDIEIELLPESNIVLKWLLKNIGHECLYDEPYPMNRLYG